MGGTLVVGACDDESSRVFREDGSAASGDAFLVPLDAPGASDAEDRDAPEETPSLPDAGSFDAGGEGGFEAGVLNLEQGWMLHNWRLTDDNTGLARYQFENDGLVAIQTANPDPSAYVNLQTYASVVIRGTFSIQTTSDDDLVGFVFGWQDPERFYLFDWKQATQVYNPCGSAQVGASLKLFAGNGAPDKCEDFWNSSGSPRATVLVNRSENPAGWKDNGTYQFTLTWKPGDIRIEVREGENVVVSLVSNDATFTSGKFGFYNYSQQAVRYEGFEVQPAP